MGSSQGNKQLLLFTVHFPIRVKSVVISQLYVSKITVNNLGNGFLLTTTANPDNIFLSGFFCSILAAVQF